MLDARDVTEAENMDQPSESSMVVLVLIFILAVVYLLSPIDIIPDVPVIGQAVLLFGVAGWGIVKAFIG